MHARRALGAHDRGDHERSSLRNQRFDAPSQLRLHHHGTSVCPVSTITPMSDVLAQAQKWSDRGDKVALATVIDTRKSAPLPPGSKMAISSTGDVFCVVSGCCVEGAVVEVAEEI